MECAKCGRELKDAKSRERGYGPVCWKKMQESDENQMVTDDIEGDAGE